LPSTADGAGVTEQGSHRLRWYNRSPLSARWLAEKPFNEMLAIYLLISSLEKIRRCEYRKELLNSFFEFGSNSHLFINIISPLFLIV